MIKNIDLLGESWYLQTDKIDDMYGKAVGVVIEKIIRQSSKYSKRSIESRISLGKILEYLGLDVSIGGSLTEENASSDEVILKLSPHAKLLIAFNALEEKELCCDLNESLRQHELKVHPYIYFKGAANFSLRVEKPEHLVVRGKVEGYEFESFCSKKYIENISSSLCDSLLYMTEIPEESLDVFCVGSIFGQKKGKLELKLYYIGGSTDDLNITYSLFAK